MSVAKAVTTLLPSDPPDNPGVAMLSPISRITELADGTLVLHDITVTSETPDSHGERINYDSFKAVAPEFMKWATVGAMHDPERWDTGTVLNLRTDDEARSAKADLHVVDPDAISKVKNRVYKAVSIHGQWKDRRWITVAGQKVRELILDFVDEISLVPRGANPDATFAKRFVVAKRAEVPDVDDEVAKAELSSAEENDLPDSAFAYVEPGEKDDEGKTVPRSNRHFNVSDEAHVRNALARLSQSPFEEKARPKVEAAARRLGIGEPAEEARKDQSMAKAAEAAPAAETTIPEPAPEKTDKKVAKAERREARKQRRLAKAADPMKVARAEASAQREVAKALRLVAKAKKTAKHSVVVVEPSHHDEPAEPDGDEPDEKDDGDEVAKALALRAIRRERRLTREVAKTRRLAKSRGRQVRKMRSSSGFGRLTRELAKIGARNNASDQAKIEAIHDLTRGLGYAKCVAKADAVHDVPPPPKDTLAADPTVAKAATPPDTIDFEALLRETVPQISAQSVAAIEATLGRQVEDLAKTVAKIANAGAGGGPLAGVGYFDPTTRQFVPTQGATGEVAKQEALAAAASALPDGDPLRQELGQRAAAADLIATRPWRRG